jgi:hypothetical protein
MKAQNTNIDVDTIDFFIRKAHTERSIAITGAFGGLVEMVKISLLPLRAATWLAVTSRSRLSCRRQDVSSLVYSPSLSQVLKQVAPPQEGNLLFYGGAVNSRAQVSADAASANLEIALRMSASLAANDSRMQPGPPNAEPGTVAR